MRLFFRERSDSRIFLILWTLCFYIHFARSWNKPAGLVIAMFACMIAMFLPNLRLSYFLSLIPVSLYLSFHYPFLANHLVLILLISLFLLVCAIFQKIEDITWISKVLLFTIAVVYSWAAVHKMNWDFINPSVSCANVAVGEYLSWFLGSEGFKEAQELTFVPFLVLFFQVLFEPLLLFRKTFLWGATVAIGFHAFLAPIGFVHFASIPLTIFFAILISRGRLNERERQLWVNFAIIYFWIQIALGILGFFNLFFSISQIALLIQFFAWIVAAIAMMFRIWYLCWPVKSCDLIPGPPMHWGWILPGVILLLGTANYLGLGTSNSFSMFSNVRTEGDHWNHIFIPKSVRVFKYQDTIYYVDTIQQSYAKTLGDTPYPNYGQPALEVYRLYDIWRTMVPLPKTYDVKTSVEEQTPISVYKLLNPDLRPFSYWEYKLLNFRPVQMTGPNRCYW